MNIANYLFTQQLNCRVNFLFTEYPTHVSHA
jgi:hypothetical protein